jgi:hypothetical protein
MASGGLSQGMPIDTSQGSLGPGASGSTLGATGNLGGGAQGVTLDSRFAQPPAIPGTQGGAANGLGLSQENIMAILLGKAPVPGTVMGPQAAIAAPQLSAIVAKPAVA